MLFKLVLVCALVAGPVLGSAIKGYSSSSELSGVKGRQPLSPIEQQRHHESTKTLHLEQPKQILSAGTKSTIQQQEAIKITEEKRREGWEQQKPLAATKTSEQKREEPIEQQRHWEPRQPTKTSAPERSEQQREEIHQKEELLQQQQQQQQTKGGSNYEAKAQIRREETKGSRLEQSSLLVAQQQQIEEQHLLGGTKSATKSADDSAQKLEQQRLEQQRLDEQKLEQQKLEQQRLDDQKLEQQRLDQQKLEQQKLELDQQRLDQQQQRYEQLQQQREEQQAVELNRDLYEQRRLEEQQQQVFVQQQQIREELTSSVKGGAIKGQQKEPIRGPAAEAEPYAFDYSVEGSSRHESGDTKGVVRGQYTLQNLDGSSRVVDYIADHNGFRATVKTNEFGTESRSPAGVEIRSSQPAAEDISLRLEGKTRELLEPQAAVKGGAPLAAQLPEPPKRPDNWNVKQAPVSLETPALPPLVIAAPIEESQRAIKGKLVEDFKAGQTLIAEKDLQQQQQQQVQLPLAQELHSEAEPAKELAKGELRTPKNLGELKKADAAAAVGQLRGPTFESATAHREINHPIHHQAQHNRNQPIRASQPSPVAPVHHRQHPPSRSQIHYDRSYQPASLGSLIRPRGEQTSTSLPLYGSSSNIESDDSAASFEHPIAE